jgi:hypothetical protein
VQGHSTAARVSASLLVSLPEFSDLPQWLVFFSCAIKAKGGLKREPLDDMSGGSALMPPPFSWGPLSQIQVLGSPGQWGSPEEHMVAGKATQVPRCGGPQISFL